MLHSRSLDSMDSTTDSVGLVRDASDVDGVTVLEANAVVVAEMKEACGFN